ncbi:MAG TPA: S46 family peptidase [Myxococcota bacterium]
MRIASSTSLSLFLVAAALLSSSAQAIEGKWLPEQVPQLDQAMLRKLGLELPADTLWNPKTGTGLLSAAVDINGCSAAFISDSGLIITNHHCAFGLIAEHASPTNNILEDGFVAKTRADELPGTTTRVLVPVAFTDVTADVHGAAAAAVDDVAIFQATDRKKKALVQACEAKPARRCDVATFYGGQRHIMMERVELTDIRLVYAPPRAVGEFGGEVDNWMWPRHTGDFAIVRAWVDPDTNAKPSTSTFTAEQRAKHVPYKPAFHFPLQAKGTKAGDFVMVLGYPGLTVRELLADEMRHRNDRFYPWWIAYSDEVIAVLEAVKDPAGAIAVAPLLKSTHNRRKNAAGQIQGLLRGQIIAKKAADDDAVLAWAKSHLEHTAAIDAHRLLLEELGTRDARFERDAVLSTTSQGSRALSMAVRMARLAAQRALPDLERDETYMERERPRHLKELARDSKAVFVAADQALLHLFIKRALALPPAQRIKAVDAVFARATTDKARLALIARMFSRTAILDDKKRDALVALSVDELRKSKDPLLDFALALNVELDEKKREDDRREGASLRLRPAWMSAVLAHGGGAVAPDANRTLRVSFAKVGGYSPADGVVALPYTSLAGLLAKDGPAPFAIPQRVKAAARTSDMTLPVDFLADGDTTGGNSGSPVVNGRGELVGVNFDRVWENVANDFGYNPAVARNVSVDIRYVVWMLRDVDHATSLLTELGIPAR